MAKTAMELRYVVLVRIVDDGQGWQVLGPTKDGVPHDVARALIADTMRIFRSMHRTGKERIKIRVIDVSDDAA